MNKNLKPILSRIDENLDDMIKDILGENHYLKKIKTTA